MIAGSSGVVRCAIADFSLKGVFMKRLFVGVFGVALLLACAADVMADKCPAGGACAGLGCGSGKCACTTENNVATCVDRTTSVEPIDPDAP